MYKAIPLLLFLWCCILLPAGAQQSVESVLKQVDKQEGVPKLRSLCFLAEHYLEEEDPKNAIKFGKKASTLGRFLNNKDSLHTPQEKRLYPYSLYLVGAANAQKENFGIAKNSFKMALKQSEKGGFTGLMDSSSVELDRMDSIISLQDTPAWKSKLNKLNDLNPGKSVAEKTSALQAAAALKVANAYRGQGKYPSARYQYNKAITAYRDLGNVPKLTDGLMALAEMELALGNTSDALEHYSTLTDLVPTNDPTRPALDAKVDSLEQWMTSTNGSAPANYDAVPTDQEDSLLLKIAELQDQALLNPEEQQELMELEEQLATVVEANELAMMEKINEIDRQNQEMQLLEQENQIQDLELQKKQADLDREAAQRQNLIISLALIILVVLVLIGFYANKQRNHAKLQKAFKETEEARQALGKAQERIKTLLGQQVSGAIAEKLITAPTAGKVEKRFVCVMFLDIRDFTPFAEKRTPEAIIEYQNQVFGFMIDIIERQKGVINQFMGDGFMATFGAPESHGNDCLHAVRAAQEIVEKVTAMSASGAIPATRVGIGMHAGEVVTGNVGTENRMQYSITGNTVILAARIEQLNKTYGTQLLISREVFDQLPNQDAYPDQFEKTQVKGRKEPVEVLALA